MTQSHETDGTESNVVRLSGDIDLATASGMRDALCEVTTGTVVADLEAVTFMDSSGLRELIEAHKRLNDEGRALRLINVPDQIQRLLEIVDVQSLFDIR